MPFLLSSLLSALSCVCVCILLSSLWEIVSLCVGGALAGRVGFGGQGGASGPYPTLPPSLAGFHRAESH